MAIQFTDHGKPIPNGNLLIVDGLNIAFRWKHAGNLAFCDEYIRTIKSLAKSYDCGEIVVLGDGGSDYRKELYPEYKANRKERFAEQTKEEEELFLEFISELEFTMKTLREKENILTLKYKGVEADDIAAFLCENRENMGLENIWLISSDKDWDLLVDENISRFSTVTRKEITLDNWDEHYDFDPEQYLTFKCLTGDKGDNVPGIPGIGPKRAVGLIKEYGDALNIYDACPINSHYKYIQALNDNSEQILINYELMDLITYCDDAIGTDNISEIRGILSGN